MDIYFTDFFQANIFCVIFQYIFQYFSYDAIFIHFLEISLIFLFLQIVSSLVNSSLRFQVFSVAFVMFTFYT